MSDSIDWKTRAIEAETELQEYQTTSAEFEAELEKELQENEKELHLLKKQYQQLQFDTSNTITRQTSQITDFTNSTIVHENKISSLSRTCDDQSTRLRKFEQKIEDLENVERQGLASINSLKLELAAQIEKNAFLESDLEEKSRTLETECQRLKDVNRDVMLDMEVQRKNYSAEPPVSPRQIASDFRENCENRNNGAQKIIQRSPQNNYRLPSPIPAGPLGDSNNFSSVSSSPDCIKNSSTTTTVNSENSVSPGDNARYHQKKSQQKSTREKQPMFFSKIFKTLQRSTSFAKLTSRKDQTTKRTKDNK